MRFTKLCTMLSTEILGIFFLLILSDIQTEGAPNALPLTTCSVTIYGTSGYMSCHFGVDLREVKYDFQVQRYDLDPADNDPDRVLLCKWKYPANLTWSVNDNYAFSGYVSDEAVIEIPKVTKEHEGRYRCQLIPPDAEMRFCTVQIPTPQTTKSTSTSNTQLVLPNVTQPQSEPPQVYSDSGGISTVGALAAGCLTGIFATVLFLAVCVRFELHTRVKNFLSTGQFTLVLEPRVDSERQREPLRSDEQSRANYPPPES